MLEAHCYNYYGDDSDSSTSSEDTPPPPVAMASKSSLPVPQDGLRDSTHEAITILKSHEGFMHKQKLIAKHYSTKNRLPLSVSSRRAVHSTASPNHGSERKDVNTHTRKVSQVEKNRKRKLKKLRAKEKRFKLGNTTGDRESTEIKNQLK